LPNKKLTLKQLDFEKYSESVLNLFLDSKEFFLDFENSEPNLSLVEKTFFSCPDGISLENKIVVGCFCDNELLGFAELIKDRHREKEWQLGIILVSKKIRKTVLGGRVILTIFDYIKNSGATCVVGGVVENNQVAKSFWKSIGAIETDIVYNQEVNGKSIPTRAVYKELL
jgi:predicted acetyltransferase